MHTNTPCSSSFLRSHLQISDAQLEASRDHAYQLFQDGHHHQVEILCRGLVASDPSDVWSHTLLVGTLAKAGRITEALVQVNESLAEHPAHQGLTAMKAKIECALSAHADRNQA